MREVLRQRSSSGSRLIASPSIQTARVAHRSRVQPSRGGASYPTRAAEMLAMSSDGSSGRTTMRAASVSSSTPPRERRP